AGRILLVDADLPRAREVPSDDWIRKQLFLEGDAELERQGDVEHRDVERGSMGDGVNVSASRIDLPEASDFHRRKDRLHDHPGPGAGEAMQDPLAVAEQRPRNGYQP